MSGELTAVDVLEEYLTDTEPGLSELRDLLVCHYVDDDAVKVLCKHAERSFPLLAGVFAAHEHLWWTGYRQPELRDTAKWFCGQVDSWFRVQCQNAADTDLCEVLCRSRTVWSDKDPLLSVTLSYRFIEYVPIEALTDKVVTEMSLWAAAGACPQLGAASRPEHNDPHRVGRWLMSRYLHNRFVEHGPSWDVFRKLYEPTKSIGDTADRVDALRNRFGEHGPSWDLLVKLHDSQGSSISEAADKVAELRNKFGTRTEPWTMLMGIYDDGSQTIDEVAEMVAALESPNR